MDTRAAFSKALKTLRQAKGLTQEDFVEVTSRIYISALERGIRTPTIDKINEISGVLDIHPLTLLTLTYLNQGRIKDTDKLFKRVQKELTKLNPD